MSAVKNVVCDCCNPPEISFWRHVRWPFGLVFEQNPMKDWSILYYVSVGVVNSSFTAKVSPESQSIKKPVFRLQNLQGVNHPFSGLTGPGNNMSSVVLLLKSKNEDDMYEKLLREHGYEPVFIPVLSFEFTNEDELMERLESPDKHCGLIFTSQRAVDAVCRCITDVKFEREWGISLREKWLKLPVFVTGKATANRVRERLKFSEIHGEESGNAESLASIILEKLPRDFSKALLFPCANIKRESLPSILEEEGYCLNCVTAYWTQADTNFVTSLEGRFGNDSDLEAIVFFSPSGVRFSCDALKQTFPSFHKIKLIAIGQATSQGLKDHGLLVSGVAPKPNPSSLVKVIDWCLKEQ